MVEGKNSSITTTEDRIHKLNQEMYKIEKEKKNHHKAPTEDLQMKI